MPRKKLAAAISQRFFEISPRSLKRWPLEWRRVNGRAHGETAEAFAVAQSMLDAAPSLMGGRRPVPKEETK
jgi:hypothetical protein